MDYQNEAECKDSASMSLLLSAYKDVILLLATLNSRSVNLEHILFILRSHGCFGAYVSLVVLDDMAKTEEEIREYHRKYYQEHKAELLVRMAIYRKKNAERIRANRIYNRTHLRSKAYDREYYLKNRDKILKYQREYRLSKALGGLMNPNIK